MKNQGRVKLGVRKASLPEDSQALEQAAQGSGCGTKLPEFQERLDNALRQFDFWVLLCGTGSWTQWSLWIPSN